MLMGAIGKKKSRYAGWRVAPCPRKPAPLLFPKSAVRKTKLSTQAFGVTLRAYRSARRLTIARFAGLPFLDLRVSLETHQGLGIL